MDTRQSYGSNGVDNATGLNKPDGQPMTRNIACFMVYVTERIAERFFAYDSARAYREMRSSGLWQFLVDTYDVSHTLSTEYLLEDAREWFKAKGVFV
jgi:hypothetical protein